MLVKSKKQRTLYIVSKAVLYNATISQETVVQTYFQKTYAFKKARAESKEIAKTDQHLKNMKWISSIVLPISGCIFLLVPEQNIFLLKNKVPIVFIRKNFVEWK